MAKTCECTSNCGDDPNVATGRTLGCSKYRARRNPETLADANDKLRKTLNSLVHLMNRMEPDVADPVREAAELEWEGLKAEAQRVLAETV